MIIAGRSNGPENSYKYLRRFVLESDSDGLNIPSEPWDESATNGSQSADGFWDLYLSSNSAFYSTDHLQSRGET